MDPSGDSGHGAQDSAWGSESGATLTTPSPRPPFAARAFRWIARLVVIFMFLQLGLWMFVGRKSLTHLAPDMIVDDVRSVAALAASTEKNAGYSERVYVISDKLAEILGDERLYRLDSSLSRFNGVLMTEDDRTYIERVNRDDCDDCLFVGIRHKVNTPFVARSFTSYTRSLVDTRMRGVEQRTREREHVYVWVLGRWIPVRTNWLSS